MLYCYQYANYYYASKACVARG